MTTSTINAKPDLRALTGLRGIAAWLVVFYHIRFGMSAYLPASVMDFLAKGYLAVDFFFLLSGFVIWLSYSGRFADDGRSKGLGYFLPFYWRRIARIWPLHLFILLGTIAFVGVLIATGRDSESGYPLSELPLHLLLLQNWGFTPKLTWNHPAWSISTEMAAYLMFPLLAAYARWDRMPSAMLIAIIAGLSLLLHFYFRGLGFDTLGQDIPRTGLLRCLTQFAIGTILCVLWQRWRKRWNAALCLSGTGIMLFLSFVAGFIPETLAIPLSFASFLLGMAILAEAPKNPLAGRVIHYFGEISYATYLVHFMLFIVFKIIFVDDPTNISPLLIGIFIAAVFAVSALLYHAVEKPGQRLFLKYDPAASKPADQKIPVIK